jgi:hypothetical protein
MATWRKSSFSGATDCVEVCRDTDHVRVRDSKNQSGHELVCGPNAWGTFLTAVRIGALDDA